MYEMKTAKMVTAMTAVLMLALGSFASAGVWSMAAWTNDATSGINASGSYTHAYNFGNNATNAPATSINGIAFDSASGTNPSASNFSLTGYGNAFGVDTNNVTTGGSDDIANSFIFGGNPGQLTLTGLSPNSTNTLNIFGVGFDESSARTATFSDPANGSIDVDENAFGNNNGIRIQYDYATDGTGNAVIDITPANGAITYHVYGFANETTGAVITDLFNTGVDGGGTPQAHNTLDTHWDIVAATNSGTTGDPRVLTSGGGFPIGPWLGDNSESAWIGPNTDDDSNDVEGVFTYETSFTLESNFNTAEIVGRFAVDNVVNDVLLNGNSLGISGSGFNAWTNFTIGGDDGFVNGLNTLQFIVFNGAGSGPTGLRVEFSSAVASFVPTPGALPAGLALLALIGARRRR